MKAAKGRLVVIAPALTKAIASAVAARIADLDSLAMTVILDANPEEYRLVYRQVSLSTSRTNDSDDGLTAFVDRSEGEMSTQVIRW